MNERSQGVKKESEDKILLEIEEELLLLLLLLLLLYNILNIKKYRYKDLIK